MNVEQNRLAAKWTIKENLARILWAAVHPLFRLSPRPFWGWRRFLLRGFGAKIGALAHIYPSARITMPWHLEVGSGSAIGDRVIIYALGPITIGTRTTISQNAHLCAGSHDWRQSDMPLLKLPITIGDDTWICADAFIGPNVQIGSNAIVGARAVVVKKVDDNLIVAGNPAQIIGRRP